MPIFQEQLEKSEPLSITHPDMTRYFMTIPEASWLILDAAAIGTSGDLFVLDMGDPVRIVDLARDLVRLAGRDPDTQPMDIVGIRPGEKLHEELFYDAERGRADGRARRCCGRLPTFLRRAFGMTRVTLLSLATGEREDQLRQALLDYVRSEGGARRRADPRGAGSGPGGGQGSRVTIGSM